MNASGRIFLSYNPNSEFEETLAIRLHTIGSVHGFQMLLPERKHKSTGLSDQTQSRIASANYFLVFATKTLNKVVKQEIEYAYEKIKDKSKIIVIHDQHAVKKTVKLENCTEILIDTKTSSVEAILSQILSNLKPLAAKGKKANKPKSDNDLDDLLAGLLLAGIGLLVLGALFSGKNKN